MSYGQTKVVLAVAAVITCSCVFLFTAASQPVDIVAGKDGPTVPAPIDEWLFAGDGFEGTFIQLTDDHRTWTAEQWRNEFANLRKIGLDTLIIQWVEYEDSNFFTAEQGGINPIEVIAATADDAGIDLYVGLSLRKSWWHTTNVNPKLLGEELTRNKQVADQIYPLLKPHKSFRGWYIPHEVSDEVYTVQQRRLILGFFKELTSFLNSLDPLKVTIASGYANPDKSNLVQFVAWWTRFFDTSGVDVLILQDGAGVAGRGKWQNILPFAEAICALDEDFEGDVWLLAEVFTQIDGPPLNNNQFKAKPADFERVRAQLDTLGAFKKKLIAYSYFDYMRPLAGPEAAQLYEAYQLYIKQKTAENAGV